MSNVPALREQAPEVLHELTIEDLTRQVATIQRALEAVMKDGEHYGVIPGTDKPSLLKPGAEKLCLLFRLAPKIRTEKVWHENGHLDVSAFVSLIHAPTGVTWVEGIEGFCTTRESKYCYRSSKRSCPTCGATTIVRSDKKGAYFCLKKEGGCGTRYAFGSSEARALDAQKMGKVANPDIADTYNTVVKMATKRALVAAVLVTTAASDIFTQDIEDFTEVGVQSATTTTQPVGGAGISESDRRELFKLAGAAGLSEEELLAIVRRVSGQDSTAELTKSQLERIKAELEATS